MITEHLTAAYDAFCQRHDLPAMSAEELLCAMRQWPDADPRHKCAAFLTVFVDLWDIAQCDDDDAHRGTA